ncbi:hypothetical protein Moror_3823 [Moniliophthora roreri MCA 2997]|uniref:Uncharacterized protein n=1 Tax=Moniliophthora roreri (strain MCA 2997) TaxID=1381753 RepID=V2XS62_MONRO|nr:hypothetical protein Moror_3823 [Moniliophthora roreri MCA 2997]KAI3611348.1 hypothetical protein WG66_002163 [Moniliophthora roreri]
MAGAAQELFALSTMFMLPNSSRFPLSNTEPSIQPWTKGPLPCLSRNRFPPRLYGSCPGGWRMRWLNPLVGRSPVSLPVPF